MSNRKIFAAACILSLFGLGACNSTYEPGESTASSVAVTSFSVRSSSKALANVDTVFFSIDLQNFEIFNADSLPYGTRINGLIPRVVLTEGASTCDFTFKKGAAMTDTVVNYAKNPNDSIDFSNGPVKMTITSPDGLNRQTYTVKVNVHQERSDSLTWADISRREIPTQLSSYTALGAAQSGNKLFIATSDSDGNSSLAVSNDPYNNAWSYVSPGLDALSAPLVESLCGGDDILYIIDSAKLYSSSDNGSTWTTAETSLNWKDIIGVYEGKAIGLTTDGLIAYSDGHTTALPDGFPTAAISDAMHFSFVLGTAPLMGVLASDGNSTTEFWGFDGINWAKISEKPILTGAKLPAVVPFPSFLNYNAWNSTEYPSLLAFGLNDSEGKPATTAYISRNSGLIWTEGGSELSIPPYIFGPAGLHAFVFTTTVHAGSQTAKALGLTAPASRATSPVSEWDVPYIYIITTSSATTTEAAAGSIWRGTINRLKYKPLI